MKQIRHRYQVFFIFLVVACFAPGSGHGVDNYNANVTLSGVSVTDFGINDDEAYDVAVQADGRILVAGMSNNGSDDDMAIARYLEDGTLDSGFGSDGRATFSIGNGNDRAYAVAVQSDGKIILAGYSDNGTDRDVAVLRLSSDGFLDKEFDGDGEVIIQVESGDDTAYRVLVQADGKIVVAGVAQFNDGQRAVVARLTRDGSLDTTFGEKGIAEARGTAESGGYSMVVQKDGKILLGGYSKTEEKSQASLFRFNVNGSQDSTFGTNGVVVLATGDGDSIGYGMALQSDLKIVMSGSSSNGEYRDILMARLNSDGSLDTSFGQGGIIISDLGHDSVTYAVAVQEDDTIVSTGYSENEGNKDIVLMRYRPDGSVDVNGDSGQKSSLPSLSASKVQADMGQSGDATNEPELESVGSPSGPTLLLAAVGDQDDVGRAVTTLPNGVIYAAGSVDNGKDNDFALLRFGVDTSDSATNSTGATTRYYLIATITITNINRNGAMSGGKIVFKGGSSAPSVAQRGVCYSTTPYPVFGDVSTISDSTEGTEQTETETEPETETGTETGSSSSILPEHTTSTSYNYETVKWGCTEDGSGVGTYGSEITQVTPGTTYYVRAYAVLSDSAAVSDDNDTSSNDAALSNGEVIYGNQLMFTTEDACFIATAAFGSILDDHVVVLRQFRDRFLTTNGPGKRFVQFYYRYSPQFAELIREDELLRLAARLALVPLVGMSYLFLNMTLVIKVLAALMLMVAVTLKLYNRNTQTKHFSA